MASLPLGPQHHHQNPPSDHQHQSHHHHHPHNAVLDQPPPPPAAVKLASAVARNMEAEREGSASLVNGNDPITGHIISTTIGGKNGEPKRGLNWV